MNRSLSVVLFALITALSASAQHLMPSVLVQNYTVDDYHAGCQNWDIAVSNDGMLYVANEDGLLSFDGNTWRHYALPDHSPLFQIQFENDSIFSIGENSCGAWTTNAWGDMVYQELPEIPPHVDMEKPQTHYLIPQELVEASPTAFAEVGELNVTGTRNGLYITDSSGAILMHLSLDNLLPDNIVHSISVQDVNLIWVALDNGISQIDIDPPLLQMGKRSELGKLKEAFLVEDELFIETNTGFFKRTMDFSLRPFQPIPAEEVSNQFLFDTLTAPTVDQLFSDPSSLDEYREAQTVYHAFGNHYWLVVDNEAALFRLEDNGSGTLRCRLDFDNYNLNLVSTGKQLFALNDRFFLVSLVQGPFLIDITRLIPSGDAIYNPPRINRMEYTDKKGVHNLLPTSEMMSLPYNFQAFAVYVATTIFTPVHKISYMIEGVSSDWSPWQKQGRISSLQLPEGKYTMRIRKYVAHGAFPEIAVEIEVRPAWYNSIWAYIVYMIIIWLIIQEGLRHYMRTLRKEEKERLEIQKQKEQQKMQQLRNEMLETELRNKNNELSLQTSALVKRNQSVREFIDELEKHKEALGDRYPNRYYDRLHAMMEEAMSDQSDWLLFESYFNSAHQNFVERLRQTYDDLTPGDLRACCLLRMNLSTKEIASLLNVTVRAVELRRYRLRKRLELDSDTNLIDFLIGF